MQSNNRGALFALVSAGLWEKFPVHGEGFFAEQSGRAERMVHGSSNVDWDEVYQLASEQSVVGVVLAGIEHSNIKPPQELLLQWIGEVQLIEQNNKAMNTFIEDLYGRMQSIGLYSILMKGQGIAQCYERPLWRTAGDIDLLLNGDSYEQAKKWFRSFSLVDEDENVFRKRLNLKVDTWDVELHGTMRGELSGRIDRLIDDVQRDIFYSGNVRSWHNGRTTVFLPSPNGDVIFVFTHILQHFFRGGIGLRQICDWCRLLWTYKDSLDHGLLESRIKKAGIMSEWNAFAAFAVVYLGMPIEAMPMYSSDRKWSRKADKICSYVMDVGNFGHNRDMSYKSQSPFFKRMMISLKYRTSDFAKQVMVFPLDAARAYWYIWETGLKVVAKRMLSKR